MYRNSQSKFFPGAFVNLYPLELETDRYSEKVNCGVIIMVKTIVS